MLPSAIRALCVSIVISGVVSMVVPDLHSPRYLSCSCRLPALKSSLLFLTRSIQLRDAVTDDLAAGSNITLARSRGLIDIQLGLSDLEMEYWRLDYHVGTSWSNCFELAQSMDRDFTDLRHRQGDTPDDSINQDSLVGRKDSLRFILTCDDEDFLNYRIVHLIIESLRQFSQAFRPDTPIPTGLLKLKNPHQTLCIGTLSIQQNNLATNVTDIS